MRHPITAFVFSLLLTVAFIALGADQLEAQAPSTISGQAALLQVTSGTAPLFSNAGSSLRFLSSATDSSYGVIGLSGNAADGYGICSYTQTGASTGKISYNDVVSGISGFVATLTFSTAATGTYSINNPAYPGQLETGTFTLFTGQAPASVAGWTFQLQIDAGVAPYATNGTAQLVVASSANTYQITKESGNVSNSSGTFAYTAYPQNSSSSSSLTLDDSVLGAEYTQTLSWQTSTSGAYVVRNVSTGAYQAGTFTGTPPFTTVSDGHGGLSIAGYTGNPPGILNIPATLNGLSVTGIQPGAFYDSPSITSISIPSSVTSIGSEAFSFCQSLTTFTVAPSNPAYISVGGVLFNKDQTSIIQYPAAKASVSFTIPTSVTSIADYAFLYCTNLSSVTFPANLSMIGNYAFSGSAINDATIPTGVTTIFDHAFANCNDLATVSIPSTVNLIGYEAFSLCVSLNAITVSASNSSYVSIGGVLFNKNQTNLIQYPAGNPAGSYLIPSTITSLGDEAFSISRNLTNVTIPNSVTSIGTDTFYLCNNLHTLALPSSVTTLGEFAFQYCGLTNVTISSSISSIPIGAFEGCNFVSVTIPATVTNLSSSAFAYCASLTKAIFLGNAPTTGSSVFGNTSDGFTVEYFDGAVGFASPIWTDTAGDNYPSQSNATPTIDGPLLVTAASGNAFSYHIPAIGLVTSYSEIGTLPPGVSLDPSLGIISGTSTVTGSFPITVTAANGAGTSNTATLTLTISTPVPFSGNPTATPESDGIPNLLKYLFDINPLVPVSATDREALASVRIDTSSNPGTDYLTLTYRKYALATGVSISLQSSTDLQTWTTVTPDLSQQTSTDPTTGDPVMEVGIILQPNATRKFIRLKVTQP